MPPPSALSTLILQNELDLSSSSKSTRSSGRAWVVALSQSADGSIALATHGSLAQASVLLTSREGNAGAQLLLSIALTILNRIQKEAEATEGGVGPFVGLHPQLRDVFIDAVMESSATASAQDRVQLDKLLAALRQGMSSRSRVPKLDVGSVSSSSMSGGSMVTHRGPRTERSLTQSGGLTARYGPRTSRPRLHTARGPAPPSVGTSLEAEHTLSSSGRKRHHRLSQQLPSTALSDFLASSASPPHHGATHSRPPPPPPPPPPPLPSCSVSRLRYLCLSFSFVQCPFYFCTSRSFANPPRPPDLYHEANGRFCVSCPAKRWTSFFSVPPAVGRG